MVSALPSTAVRLFEQKVPCTRSLSTPWIAAYLCVAAAAAVVVVVYIHIYIYMQTTYVCTLLRPEDRTSKTPTSQQQQPSITLHGRRFRKPRQSFPDPPRQILYPSTVSSEIRGHTRVRQHLLGCNMGDGHKLDPVQYLLFGK